MRNLRCSALVLTFAVLAGACGAGERATTGSTSDAPVGTGAELTSNVARTVADPAAASAIGTALDQFGGALYASIAGADSAKDSNTAISPLSVAAALLMVRAGARGETRAEIDRALALTGIDVDAGFNALDQALASRKRTFTGPDGSQKQLVLSMANALWAQDGYPVAPEFLDTLAASYGAGLHTVDYAGRAEDARRQINAWVAERTNDKIPELLGPGLVDAQTVLVLTNALYLNAPWAIPFVPSGTQPAPFTRLDASPVTVSMMHQYVALPYAGGDDWQAVELPYVGNKLAMDVIVPRTGKFEAVERELSLGAAPFVAGLRSERVDLALPKFTFRTQADLVEPLRAMGIEQLFDGRADLSGMGPGGLFATVVVHETYIAVTEQGTEAAAATAFGFATSGSATPPRVVTADRPFLFVIRDLETGAVLLLGRVLDPTHP